MRQERSSAVRAPTILLLAALASGCGSAPASTTSGTGDSGGQGGSGGQGTGGQSTTGGTGGQGTTTSTGGQGGSGGSGGSAPTKAVTAWSKHFGDEAKQFGEFVGVSASGNVVVAGSFSGSVDFGGGVLTAAAPTSSDFFVA